MPVELHKWDSEEPHLFTNVQEYTWKEENNTYAWQITYEARVEKPSPEKPIYFILDSMNHSAFCHWVYENALWLPLFHKIKKDYPSCKLIVEDRKQYKQLFLEFYNISSDDVCLHKDIESGNTCFFHAYTSLNDPSIPLIYYKHVQDFQQRLSTISVEKSIPILYLPRGTKENLQGPNNRSYNIQEQLKDILTASGGTVYETDKTLRLEDQIRIVKSAKIIVLDYGSNLWVNGLFAESSQLLCLNIGWQHHSQFPSLGYIWNCIHQTNTVTQVYAYPSEQITENSVPVVCFQLQDILYGIQHFLDISRKTQ